MKNGCIIIASRDIITTNDILVYDTKEKKEENTLKSTIIVKRIDRLGRIMLPAELREQANIQRGDPLSIMVDQDCIIFQKYLRSCLFCGNTENLITFRDKLFCTDCQKNLQAYLQRNE